MSNVETEPREATGGSREAVAPVPVHEPLSGREVVLGTRGLTVTRTLPHRDRRMVGAWCFVDHYGPEDISHRDGMRVPPHPHTGLQTVSWLVQGAVLHRDSLGNRATVEPGQLALMTAGRAIAHAEVSPDRRPPVLHGVQLWIALPDAHRNTAPGFTLHADLPVVRHRDATLTVMIGEMGGTRSPATAYTPIVGAELSLSAGGATTLPLRAGFEHAVLALTGEVTIDGAPVRPGPLLYLGCGRTQLEITAVRDSRLLLLGGEPFEERIVMWWNFVARSHDEIVASRADWVAGRRFGPVTGYDGDPLPAPPLPATPLRPRSRHR